MSPILLGTESCYKALAGLEHSVLPAQPSTCSDCQCTPPSLAPWLTILHLTRNYPNSKRKLSLVCIPLSLDSLFTSILIFKMRELSTEKPVRVTHTPAYAWSHGAQDSNPESIPHKWHLSTSQAPPPCFLPAGAASAGANGPPGASKVPGSFSPAHLDV